MGNKGAFIKFDGKVGIIFDYKKKRLNLNFIL